ncbi:hypothetical protein [Vibrio sp. HN007]|uniref:hypothetical protein n=1 Tax=Vibrio iocasae TaxID=3098914 RepID=UPI0035D43E2B
MKVEQLQALIREADALESEIDQLRGQFQNVSMKQLLKKLMKLSTSGGISPEALGLPANVMDKLSRYQELNKTIRNVMNQILEGQANAEQQ